MSRDLTLHIIRCTIAGAPARVYSCNKREATTFARRLHARVVTSRLPSSWRALLPAATNDHTTASPSRDHAATAATAATPAARRTRAARNLLAFPAK